MAIETIGRIGDTAVASAQASVGLEDFLNIFLTQLNYQDPLEPVDNREFLAQLAQFSSVELANRTNENSEALLDLNGLSQSIGLLGRQVNVLLEGGSSSGEVIAMNLVNGQPRLTVSQVDGSLISVSPTQVSAVIQLSPEN
ncbi:MAG: flagellar basal-body rod modification protein FlgD [Halioglobus sp.]|jgi:flagellar basal-body rod modification protein FlgD